MVRILAIALSISFLFNAAQFTLLDSCKVKIKVQNEMVQIANQQREEAITERDKKAQELAKDYKRRLELINIRPVGDEGLSCEQSLDSIINAMKEVSYEPDNA